MKVNLMGYYGMNNIGDELMRVNLINYFRTKKQIDKVNVFCRKAPDVNDKLVRYYHLNKFSKISKAIQLIKNDHTYWGGGTCLYQSENSNGLFALRNMQKIVKKSGKKFSFLGIGIGKLQDARYIDTAKELLENADQCYFRDEQSMQRAKELYPHGDYCIGGDLVFLGDIEEKKVGRSNITNISVSAHSLFNEYPPQFYSDILIALIKKFKCKISFIPAHSGNSYNDNEMHKKIAVRLPESSFEILDWQKENEYINKLAEMDFHIGVRLHSLVIADIIGIPNLGISYSPKVKSYIRKTAMIPELRTFNKDNFDAISIVTQIFEYYKRPSEFIDNERKTALECLNRIV